MDVNATTTDDNKEVTAMSGSVTSPTAFNAYTNYSLNNLNLNSVMRKLATGIKGVVDDGAGVAISERMRSQANSTAKARGNVDNAISLLQTADTWLQQIGDLVGRMHELAVDAKDATKTSTDTANIQTEFAGLQDEIGRVTGSAAKFNGKFLFSGSLSGIGTQVGADNGQTINLSLTNLTREDAALTSTLMGGVTDGAGLMGWQEILHSSGGDPIYVGLSVASNLGGVNTAMNFLSDAVNFIARQRASIGAQQERFEKTRAGLLTYEDQIRTAESKIRTVDTAKESSEMMKYQILGQIGTAMLAQANQLPAAAVQLVG